MKESCTQRGRWGAVWLATALGPWLVACGAATGVLDERGSPESSSATHLDAGTQAGRDSSSVPPRSDASSRDATIEDVRAQDAPSRAFDGSQLVPDATVSSDAAADADAAQEPDAAEDAALTLNPDELVEGHGLTLFGVTDHGLIIYGDAEGTCYALPFAARTPQVISPPFFTTDAGPGRAAFVGVSHDVVFMSATDAGPGYVWSAALGTPALLANPMGAPGSVFFGGASSDSLSVAYGYGIAFGGRVEYLAHVDGSNAVFEGNESVAFDESIPVVGPGAGPGCPGCGGAVAALDRANGWAATVLSATAYDFAVDEVGANALIYQGGSGTIPPGLLLAPLDGGTPTLLDPNAAGSDFYLSPTSSFALYLAQPPGSQALQIEAVSLPGGVPYAVSATATAHFMSLEAVQPVSPVGPVAVYSVSGGEAIIGVGPGATSPNLALTSFAFAGFTSDGSFALLAGPAVQGVVPFGAISLAPGSQPEVLSTSSLFFPTALGDTTVLYCDNYVAAGAAGAAGTTDLRVADVARGTSSVLVASGVYAASVFDRTVYGVSPDRTEIAYTRNSGAATDGLYVTTLPPGP